jgi:hypothetical protein
VQTSAAPQLIAANAANAATAANSNQPHREIVPSQHRSIANALERSQTAARANEDARLTEDAKIDPCGKDGAEARGEASEDAEDRKTAAS